MTKAVWEMAMEYLNVTAKQTWWYHNDSIYSM